MPAHVAKGLYLVHQECLPDVEGSSNAGLVLGCDVYRLQVLHRGGNCGFYDVR
jgi:hypothetical protein